MVPPSVYGPRSEFHVQELSSTELSIVHGSGGTTEVALGLRKKAAQVTIWSNSKQWDEWCSESGSYLREEDKSLIRDLLADLEERKRTERLLVRIQKPCIVVILPTEIEEQRRN